MPEVIIGRKEEIALLKKLNDKNSAQFGVRGAMEQGTDLRDLMLLLER
ncbi:MAG: hypothetical protein KBD76_09910 [Bacteriovorax sp.]|nr:hypothetical protein [Bacteriovorax sp.]